MTCIVAYKQDGKVYMGADSCAAGGNSSYARQDDKIFKNGCFLFGFTSSFRMGQLLGFSLNPPPYCTNKSVFEYMCTDFINAVRECFIQGGFSTKSNNNELGGVFITAFHGEIFIIDSDFQVGIPLEPYAAVGSGEEYARGAMHAIWEGRDKNISSPIEDVLRPALSAAHHFTGTVKPPFVFSTL